MSVSLARRALEVNLQKSELIVSRSGTKDRSRRSLSNATDEGKDRRMSLETHLASCGALLKGFVIKGLIETHESSIGVFPEVFVKELPQSRVFPVFERGFVFCDGGVSLAK